MPSVIHETQLTADFKSWVDTACLLDATLPFSGATVEERKGSTKRNDLTIRDRSGRVVLTGEFKMPDKADGTSPYNESVVLDAQEKANRFGASYFFTCNVNRLVLWQTFQPGTSILERHLEELQPLAKAVMTSDEIAHESRIAELKAFVPILLRRVARIETQEEPIQLARPDVNFVRIWEAVLEQPILHARASLQRDYHQDRTFRRQLDDWMRSEQGWAVSTHESAIARMLDDAARFATYGIATKIIFHRALRKVFPKAIRAFAVNDGMETGEINRALQAGFKNARDATGDYETVFADPFGDSIPFRAQSAAHVWRELLKKTSAFDFTEIGYDVIGGIFEQVLSTTERHKYGQHFTRSEVVDLINAFCIRKGDEYVMDPSCGGGTFLVRAYARKKWLLDRGHIQLLNEIYGTDVSDYPARLSTINLATRDLIRARNYPHVVRSDFFALEPDGVIQNLPVGSRGQMETVYLPRFDAVIGNPPYLRQEEIDESFVPPKTAKAGDTYKDHVRRLTGSDQPNAHLSKRSDFHCYFWAHSLRFVKEGGRIALLVSSNWLDTGYGYELQKFFLDRFAIEAIYESEAEPWFTGARVKTTAVILRRESDPAKREENSVRFVLFRRPLAELLGRVSDGEERFAFFDELRDWTRGTAPEVFLSHPTENGDPIEIGQASRPGYRLRSVRQSDLRRMGTSWGGGGYEEDKISLGAYQGSKWGLFLRAPDVYFQIVGRSPASWVTSPELFRAYFGVKSGNDKFFFVKDVTEQRRSWGAKRLAEIYGPEANDPRFRIIEGIGGWVQTIEAEVLEPVAFNLMEVRRTEFRRGDAGRWAVTLRGERDDLPPRARAYVAVGEREGAHTGSSVRARGNWWELPEPHRGALFWSKAWQYRHVVPLNMDGLACANNLYDLIPEPQVDPVLLTAVLNSTPMALVKHQTGRVAGTEGVLKTEVSDVKRMIVPDVRNVPPRIAYRLRTALGAMAGDEIGKLVDVEGVGTEPGGECANLHRQDLDDAVFELLGFPEPEERKRVRAALYEELARYLRAVRATEKEANRNKARAKSGSKVTPEGMAQEILDEMSPPLLWPDLAAWAKTVEHRTANLPKGDAKLVTGLFPAVRWGKGASLPVEGVGQGEYLVALSSSGWSGPVPVPTDPQVAGELAARYHGEVREIEDRVREAIQDRTEDAAFAKKISKAVFRRLVSSPTESGP